MCHVDNCRYCRWRMKADVDAPWPWCWNWRRWLPTWVRNASCTEVHHCCSQTCSRSDKKMAGPESEWPDLSHCCAAGRHHQVRTTPLLQDGGGTDLRHMVQATDCRKPLLEMLNEEVWQAYLQDEHKVQENACFMKADQFCEPTTSNKELYMVATCSY